MMVLPPPMNKMQAPWLAFCEIYSNTCISLVHAATQCHNISIIFSNNGLASTTVAKPIYYLTDKREFSFDFIWHKKLRYRA